MKKFGENLLSKVGHTMKIYPFWLKLFSMQSFSKRKKKFWRYRIIYCWYCSILYFDIFLFQILYLRTKITDKSFFSGHVWIYWICRYCGHYIQTFQTFKIFKLLCLIFNSTWELKIWILTCCVTMFLNIPSFHILKYL